MEGLASNSHDQRWLCQYRTWPQWSSICTKVIWVAVASGFPVAGVPHSDVTAQPQIHQPAWALWNWFQLCSATAISGTLQFWGANPERFPGEQAAWGIFRSLVFTKRLRLQWVNDNGLISLNFGSAYSQKRRVRKNYRLMRLTWMFSVFFFITLPGYSIELHQVSFDWNPGSLRTSASRKQRRRLKAAMADSKIADEALLGGDKDISFIPDSYQT